MYVLCTYILCDHYTHNACITLRGVSTSVLQESQGLTTYAFVMLLLAMISLHMLTCRLMVIMVAEFCPLVILIHNTLLGEITIIWEAREWYCLPGAICYCLHRSYHNIDHWGIKLYHHTNFHI